MRLDFGVGMPVITGRRKLVESGAHLCSCALYFIIMCGCKFLMVMFLASNLITCAGNDTTVLSVNALTVFLPEHSRAAQLLTAMLN